MEIQGLKLIVACLYQGGLEWLLVKHELWLFSPSLAPRPSRGEKGYPLFAHVHTTLWFHGVLYSIVNKPFIFSVTLTSTSQLISPIWKMSATNHALLKRQWGESMVNPEHRNSQNKQRLGVWSGNGCMHTFQRPKMNQHDRFLREPLRYRINFHLIFACSSYSGIPGFPYTHEEAMNALSSPLVGISHMFVAA